MAVTSPMTADSEYIRDLIRHDQARQPEVDAIRGGGLIKGEGSGQPQVFDGDLFPSVPIMVRHCLSSNLE